MKVPTLFSSGNALGSSTGPSTGLIFQISSTSATGSTSVEGMCKCTHAILCRHTMYAIRVIFFMLRATFCSAGTEIATPPTPPHGADDIGVVTAVVVTVNVTILTVILVIIVAVIIACKLRQKQQTPLEGMNGLECFNFFICWYTALYIYTCRHSHL